MIKKNLIIVMGLFWYCVYIVVLNDLGCFFVVYLMYSVLVFGWVGLMVFYELVVFDFFDLVLNLMWC